MVVWKLWLTEAKNQGEKLYQKHKKTKSKREREKKKKKEKHQKNTCQNGTNTLK